MLWDKETDTDLEYTVESVLPELPDNLYWRIERDPSAPVLRIMWVKQRKFLGPVSVPTRWYAYVLEGVSRKTLKRAADSCLRQREEWLQIVDRSSEDRYANLYGDYR